MIATGLDAERIQGALRTRRFGHELEVYASIDSTNTRAAEWAREGCAEGAVVLADSQERGRGRLGRAWVSPPACNLYASIVVRPDLRAADIPMLTLVAGLVVAETIAAHVGERVAIKWPNDVQIHGRKAAGILTELEADRERVRFAVVGIGVNLNVRRDELPAELRAIATSIRAESGRDVDRELFCASLLAGFETRYDRFVREGFDPIRPDWNQWNGLEGRHVRIVCGERSVAGRVRGLRSDGRLEVETPTGLELVVAGDVSVADEGEQVV